MIILFIILSVQAIFFICYLYVCRLIFYRVKNNHLLITFNSLLFIVFNIINYLFFSELFILISEYENPILLSIISTIIIFLTANYYKIKDPSKNLRSYVVHHDSMRMTRYRKNVSEIKNRHISTYPRITIFEGDSEKFFELECIFDSSDFEVINSEFKATEGVQESFQKDAQINKVY